MAITLGSYIINPLSTYYSKTDTYNINLNLIMLNDSYFKYILKRVAVNL